MKGHVFPPSPMQLYLSLYCLGVLAASLGPLLLPLLVDLGRAATSAARKLAIALAAAAASAGCPVPPAPTGAFQATALQMQRWLGLWQKRPWGLQWSGLWGFIQPHLAALAALPQGISVLLIHGLLSGADTMTGVMRFGWRIPDAGEANGALVLVSALFALMNVPLQPTHIRAPLDVQYPIAILAVPTDALPLLYSLLGRGAMAVADGVAGTLFPGFYNVRLALVAALGVPRTGAPLPGLPNLRRGWQPGYVADYRAARVVVEAIAATRPVGVAAGRAAPNTTGWHTWRGVWFDH